jgi:2-methylcitrate dehydratase PrpD
MSHSRDLVHDLADHAANLRFEDLSVDARESAKKSLLDTVGVCLAASGLEPAASGVIEIVRESGGTPQSSLLGFGGRVPALSAALGNGALAHCLDYDDQTPWGQHAGSSVVPAVFAVAERQGGVSGANLIAAVAAGQDIFGRLRRHVGWKKDWNLSTVLGVLAATAAAARVIDLPGRRVAHAMGIATMQSSGIMEMVAGRGSDLRGLYAGFSAKGAVLAALMAQRGVTGIDRMFEGEYGFMQTYFSGRYDRAEILRNLGTEFFGSGTLYKRWPCVGTAHSHMKAAIDIVMENDLDPWEIREIRLHVGDYHSLMCQPLAERRAPATLADAKFSLPFLVSVAIVRRGMSVTDFTAARLCHPEILEIGKKMTLVTDSALDWTLELPLGRVEIVAQDGRSWTKEGRGVPGNADCPMTWDDLCAKFAECASANVTAVAEDKVTRVSQLARNMDGLQDGTEMIRALT